MSQSPDHRPTHGTARKKILEHKQTKTFMKVNTFKVKHPALSSLSRWSPNKKRHKELSQNQDQTTLPHILAKTTQYKI